MAKWEATGICPPEIDQHDLPGLTSYLWQWWLELNADRPVGLGLSGIPSTEIEAWARLSGRALAPWEFRTIKIIDRLYLASRAEQDDADRKRDERSQKSAARR